MSSTIDLSLMNRRVNLKRILADRDLRRKLMVSTIQATQAREGIETTEEQAQRAYDEILRKQRECHGGKRHNVPE